MKMSLYSIFDSKTGEANPPSLFKNDAAALRAFQRQLPDMSFPDDQSLFYIAEFDTETLQITEATSHLVEATLDMADEEEGI